MRRLLPVLAVLFLLGCGGGSSPAPTPEQTRAYQLACDRVTEDLGTSVTVAYPPVTEARFLQDLVYGVTVIRVYGSVYVNAAPLAREWAVDVRHDGETWIAHRPDWTPRD